jgi:hypothetical protein
MSGTLKVGGKTLATHDTNTNVAKIQLGSTSDVVLTDSAGNNVLSESGGVVTLTADEANVGSNALVVDASGNVGIGTSSPNNNAKLDTVGSIISTNATIGTFNSDNSGFDFISSTKIGRFFSTSTDTTGGVITFTTGQNGSYAERMRIDSSGYLVVGKNGVSNTVQGISLGQDGQISAVIQDSGLAQQAIFINRQDSDGTLILFRQANITEGSISVSGTTVSLTGGHLSRWSQLPDDSKDETIVKGTVMSNLDAMCEWSHLDEYWTEEDEIPVDEEGNPTAAVGDLKKASYTEDNEQLNRMVVSSVEGDPNVAGVFVNWDNDDDIYTNDMNIAMTGDMVIRIAQATTVQRGDLLMSAGDGTAKPQGDDIVRSKTIAKVTSTHVSHTYEDGSYLVPCVLMAS